MYEKGVADVRLNCRRWSAVQGRFRCIAKTTRRRRPNSLFVGAPRVTPRVGTDEILCGAKDPDSLS